MPAGRKTLRVAICLIVLLAAVSIIAYKIMNDSSNSNNSFSQRRMYPAFPFPNSAVNFAFGQPASENTSPLGNAIQAEQNLGEYVESFDELNLVAADNDVVFVFIPGAGNTLIDDKTKTAIFEIKKDLERSNTKIGLYTLWCDSQEYLEITEKIKMPAIVVARNGKGTITMSGSNVNESMLLQAYLKAATEGCCEYYTPGCC